ncbi:MAG: TIGR03067 domain-containing protein [Isosphaeraceae bacterium]
MVGKAATLGLVVVLLGMGTTGECRAGEAVTGDLAKMQGKWVTRAGERKELKVALEIDGTQVKVEIRTPQGLTINAKGELRVDSTVTPHALDWVNFTGADTIEMPEIPAIYELKGETLRVCNGGPNNARPTEFKAGAGILSDLHVFERPTTTTTAAAGH